MTFEELQNAVMTGLNLSSTEARTRVKTELNLRYREVQSSLQLERTRRGTADFTTSSGTATVTASGVAKLLGLYDGTVRFRPLDEMSVDEIKTLAAHNDEVNTPTCYAINDHLNDVIVIRLYPRPNAAIALEGDCLLAGTDMVENDDEPTFPVDYHDILVRGARADEYLKMDKPRQAAVEEAKFEKRLSELRYFIAKSSTKKLRTTDRTTAVGLTTRVWPYDNLA